MILKRLCIAAGLCLLATLGHLALGAGVGTLFTYQGRLTDNGAIANGNYDLQCAVYDAPSFGNPVGPTLTFTNVAVSTGMFAVALDFGNNVFAGEARWLDLRVRTNGAAGFTVVSPRQAVTPTPYALFAPNAANAVNAANAANALIASNVVAGAVSAPQLNTSAGPAAGQILSYSGTTLAWTNPGSAAGAWLLGGNSSTTPGAQFLGTTDNQPLELKVNGLRTLRLEPNPSSPNWIGGSAANSVTPGISGATIAGGGSPSLANQVTGPNGTVGGGAGNVASTSATVGGGWNNSATGEGATIAGGRTNTASGAGASVVGGTANSAGGLNSVAAGYRAKANHLGTFVWGDSTEADFPSGAANQFLIRASGGVGIGTNDPVSALQVAGVVTANAFHGDGSALTGLTGSNLTGTVTGTITFNPTSGPPFIVGSTNTNVVAYLNADLLDGNHAAAFWQLGGNGGTVATNFLGTTDNQPLEFRVNGQRALRLEPNTISPNVVGGAVDNLVPVGAMGATIGGGGAAGQRNTAGTNFATVAGGIGNAAVGVGAAVSGGSYNLSAGDNATVSGGTQNGAGGYRATVGGGENNSASGAKSTVAGGTGNVASGLLSTVSGGSANTVGSEVATIAGGGGNTIQANAYISTIGGGTNNTVQSGSSFATIAGGWRNTIYGNGFACTISGGAKHQIQSSAMFSTIAGGTDNTIEDNATDCTISGGEGNTIETSALDSTIAGGKGHLIESAAPYSTIGGGENNTIRAGAEHATIGGGGQNIVHTNAWYGTIAGGLANEIRNDAVNSSIGGGELNVIQPGADHATIPGGSGNVVAGPYGFAAGHGAQALHAGSFVWADNAGPALNSTAGNQFTARAAGGVTFFSDPTAKVGVQLAPGGISFSPTSDRNVKENFQPVNPRAVLEKVSHLPVTEWNLKTQPASIRHIGPMAQDFAAAFNVGEDDRHISTSDADGVVLAAIQGLHQIVKEKEAEIESLKKAVADLQELVKTLAMTKGAQQ